MPTVTRCRSILRLVEETPEHVTFGRSDAEDGGHTDQVHVRQDVWEELGRPDTVTVTIEPGDLLNV